MKYHSMDPGKTYIDCQGFTWENKNGTWTSFNSNIDNSLAYKYFEEREFFDPLKIPFKPEVQNHEASEIQVDGTHYKNYAIQPFEFFSKNKVPHGEACAIKYLLRHKKKNGIKDLEKAKHYIDLIIEMEYK